MKTKYYWKELTEDGLLRNATYCNPPYGWESLNVYGSGFESKEQAIKYLDDMSHDPKYSCTIHHELVLVEVYCPEKVF